MAKRSPVLVLGEALVDVVHANGEINEHVGGSPANVAFGLGRLEHDVVIGKIRYCTARGDGSQSRPTARAQGAADGVEMHVRAASTTRGCEPLGQHVDDGVERRPIERLEGVGSSSHIEECTRLARFGRRDLRNDLLSQNVQRT